MTVERIFRITEAKDESGFARCVAEDTGQTFHCELYIPVLDGGALARIQLGDRIAGAVRGTAVVAVRILEKVNPPAELVASLVAFSGELEPYGLRLPLPIERLADRTWRFNWRQPGPATGTVKQLVLEQLTFLFDWNRSHPFDDRSVVPRLVAAMRRHDVVIDVIEHLDDNGDLGGFQIRPDGPVIPAGSGDWEQPAGCYAALVAVANSALAECNVSVRWNRTSQNFVLVAPSLLDLLVARQIVESDRPDHVRDVPVPAVVLGNDPRAILAEARNPIAARLAAFESFAASDDDALAAFCANFIDGVVTGGWVLRAFDDAARRIGAPLAERPTTVGVNARGLRQLIADPPSVGAAIPIAVRALARHAAARPALARWLFEAAQLPPPYRADALAGLASLPLELAALADCLDEIVAIASLREAGGSIIRDIACALCNHPDWLVALIERLVADPTSGVADALRGDDFSCEPLPLDAVTIDRLSTWATSAPSGARALALLALANARVGPAATDLERIVLAGLAEAQVHPAVLDAAAVLSRRRAVGSPAVIAELSARLADRGGSNAGKALQHARLDAERRGSVSGSKAAPGPDLDLYTSHGRAHGLAVIGDSLLQVSVHEGGVGVGDVVAVTVVGTDDTPRRFDAPIRFERRSAHARTLVINGALDNRIVFVVKGPLESAMMSYVLGFDPDLHTWCVYRSDHDRLTEQPLIHDTYEEALPRIGSELIVWIDDEGGHVVRDSTPYYWEGAEPSPTVHAASAKAHAARRPWQRLGDKAAMTTRMVDAAREISDVARLAATITPVDPVEWKRENQPYVAAILYTWSYGSNPTRTDLLLVGPRDQIRR